MTAQDSVDWFLIFLAWCWAGYVALQITEWRAKRWVKILATPFAIPVLLLITLARWLNEET